MQVEGKIASSGLEVNLRQTRIVASVLKVLIECLVDEMIMELSLLGCHWSVQNDLLFQGKCFLHIFLETPQQEGT
jgi:hypothetical protein